MFHWGNLAELKSQKRAPQQELFKKQHHPNSIVYQISRSRNLNLEKSYKYGNESRVSEDLFVCPLETRSWFLNSMQPCKLTKTHVREIYIERVPEWCKKDIVGYNNLGEEEVRTLAKQRMLQLQLQLPPYLKNSNVIFSASVLVSFFVSLP